MNQPKFKFGEVVVYTKNPKSTFRVQRVMYLDQGKKGFYYGCNDGFPDSHEDEIELYQEPQKKKLYAFQKNPHEFLLSAHETLPFSYSFWTRAPEYDIEYNATTPCKEQENTEVR